MHSHKIIVAHTVKYQFSSESGKVILNLKQTGIYYRVLSFMPLEVALQWASD